MNHEDSSIVLVKWQSRVWEHVVSLFGCDRLREMSMRSSFQQIPLKHEEHALRAERPGLLRLGIHSSSPSDRAEVLRSFRVLAQSVLGTGDPGSGLLFSVRSLKALSLVDTETI